MCGCVCVAFRLLDIILIFEHHDALPHNNRAVHQRFYYVCEFFGCVSKVGVCGCALLASEG